MAKQWHVVEEESKSQQPKFIRQPTRLVIEIYSTLYKLKKLSFSQVYLMSSVGQTNILIA